MFAAIIHFADKWQLVGVSRVLPGQSNPLVQSGHQVRPAPRILSMNTTRDPWARAARGNIYLIASFRTVSSISLPFASSIQAL
jgi:hypothetical protein